MISNKTIQEEIEDTKGVIRIRKSKKNRRHNGQKDKQRSTKHYTENKHRTTLTLLKPGMNLGAPEGSEFLLHQSYLSCFSSYIPGNYS